MCEKFNQYRVYRRVYSICNSLPWHPTEFVFRYTNEESRQVAHTAAIEKERDLRGDGREVTVWQELNQTSELVGDVVVNF